MDQHSGKGKTRHNVNRERQEAWNQEMGETSTPQQEKVSYQHASTAKVSYQHPPTRKGMSETHNEEEYEEADKKGKKTQQPSDQIY